MIHHATSSFWDCYDRLPPAIQHLADKNYELLKLDPDHPSLRFKKVGLYSLVSHIELLGWRMAIQLFGFGLVIMMSMSV
jgi:hypothetical protein